jgi:hypothetical protein
MTLPLTTAPVYPKDACRRSFIGGSDARIIMGNDEAALERLWREKRGEAEPPDYSDNLIVQLGVATEPLNRRWYEKATGQVIKGVQSWIRHPVIRWMAATLDGLASNLNADHFGLHPEAESLAYFRPGCLGFCRNTPSPKRPSLLKAIPERSRAIRIALTASSETCRRSFSKSTTVERPRSALWARSDCVMSNKARAALHCAGVISTNFVDNGFAHAYQ